MTASAAAWFPRISDAFTFMAGIVVGGLFQRAHPTGGNALLLLDAAVSFVVWILLDTIWARAAAHFRKRQSS